MNSTIFVINPNSLRAVTDDIDAALTPLRRRDGPDLVCLTLAEGPPGIQTQRDVEAAIPPLMRTVAERASAASGFVVACFSDPGLAALREITPKPVVGIGEAGMLTALTLGQCVGVIAILGVSIPRHLRYYGAMGISSRIEVGRELRDARGADVLVVGCAGMAVLRSELQRAVGVPVVDPCQAAVANAIGRVQLDWHAA